MSTLPIKSIYINKWDGGQTGDPRDEAVNVQRVIQHFDNYTRTFKLTPYRDMIADYATESTGNSFKIQNLLAVTQGTGADLWGLGDDGSNHVQIYFKESGSSLNSPTYPWTAAPGTIPGSGSYIPYFFVLYHNYLYYCNGTGIYKYGDITSGGGETYASDSESIIPTAQGLVHSKDDTMYIPVGNTIYSNLNGSYNAALTLPAHCAINSICEYGNYLAIATDQPDGTCTVYLWDRNASLTTLPEIIRWGAGSIKLIETVAGILCGISITSGSTTSLNPRVMFKYYSGTSVEMIQEFVCSTLIINISLTKQVYNNIFYFLADFTVDGTQLQGLWKIFKNPQGKLAVSFDRYPRNGTIVNALTAFCRWGDYLFIAYQIITTAAYTIWRTDDQANYTATSTVSTAINPSMPVGDRAQLKKLLSVGATYEALPSGASMVISYRVDGGSWIPVFTETTTGKVRTEPVSINGGDGTEFEFQITSTGGGEVTSYFYKYNIIPTNQ